MRPQGSGAHVDDDVVGPGDVPTIVRLDDGAPTEVRLDEAAQGDELSAVKDQLLVFARELNAMYLRERSRRRELEEALAKLSQSYAESIAMLGYVVEAKDSYTRAHLERTYEYALALTHRIDPELAADKVVGYGFLLHDVGKVAVPETILRKPGPLDEEEWRIMRRHPTEGEQIVQTMQFLQPALSVIRHHHERWDGAGYPDRLAGEDIPLAARIFAVADTFDAMTTDRPYRSGLGFEVAVEEIARCAGSQFDPGVVQEFLRVCDDLWRDDPPSA